MSEFRLTRSATLKISIKATALVCDFGYLGYQSCARTRDAFLIVTWVVPFKNVTRLFDIVQRYSVSSAKLIFMKPLSYKAYLPKPAH